MTIAEPDWKTFKRLRPIALDRFCQRVVDECQAVCANQSLTAHERYGELCGLLRKRDKEMAQMFDDFRRSTAIQCLMLMASHGLFTEKELSEFGPEIRGTVCAK